MPEIENTPPQPRDIIQSTLAFTMPRITYGRRDTVLSFYAYDGL